MSKIKQLLEEQIVISYSEQENTGWKRVIFFEYEGNKYEVNLYWDEFNGYEVFWREPNTTPNWVVEWDSEAHSGMSFEHYLDDLTWESDK